MHTMYFPLGSVAFQTLNKALILNLTRLQITKVQSAAGTGLWVTFLICGLRRTCPGRPSVGRTVAPVLPARSVCYFCYRYSLAT